MRILLLEDDPTLLALFHRAFSRRGWEVHPVADAASVAQAATAGPFDAVVADQSILARLSGPPAGPLLVLSGLPWQPDRPDAAFLQKPFTLESLLEAVESLVSGAR